MSKYFVISKDLDKGVHAVCQFRNYMEAYRWAEGISDPPNVKAFAVASDSLESVQRTHSSWFIGERVGRV